MSARTLTETQWLAKSALHLVWEASWRSEMKMLDEMIDGATDIKVVERIIDRVCVIEKRIEQLHRIVARHVERAPAQILPELVSALGIQVH